MRVSVITVSYNSESTIKETIESVLSQDYNCVEYIIIDGGSSDSTMQIVEAYRDRISSIISEQDKGIYDAMNKGIKTSTGDIICILNSDDVYRTKQVISKIVDVFKAKPSTQAILTDIQFFIEKKKRIYLDRYVSASWFKPERLRYGWMPPHPGTFIRRHVYSSIGLYNLSYSIAADYEFMVRVFMVNHLKYQIIPCCTVLMRKGGVSTSGVRSSHIITKEIVRSCVENGIYTNSFLVILRLPIKWLLKLLG